MLVNIYSVASTVFMHFYALTYENMRIIFSNCVHRISRPEVNFSKKFHVTLDRHKHTRDVGHRKTQIMKFFDKYKNLTNLCPVGLTFSDTTKEA